jgi:hypothetical protein
MQPAPLRYGRILAATWPQLVTKAATAVVASTIQTVSPIVLKVGGAVTS